MSCGHEQEVELFGKTSARERKISYFETQGLCKACYSKKMQVEMENEPFSFHASVLPYIDENNGEILVFVWFSGNTKPHKEKIKEIGYSWQTRDVSEGMYGLDYQKPELCWGKIIYASEFEQELEKAYSLGAEKTIMKNTLETMIAKSIASDQQKKWEKKYAAITSLEKPKIPEIIKGHRWNHKIYGKIGHYSIYPDGEKMEISNEQAKDLEEYLEEKRKYDKKVEEIKRC